MTAFLDGFLDGLRPDEDLLLWEWSDRYRILTSESSAEPGPWRTSRLPYAYGPMEALSDRDHCTEVVVQKGAQLGFTEIGNCWVGMTIHISPCPVMVVQSTLELAKRYTKQRLDPMIEACPVLKERVGEQKSKDASNTMTAKSFPGGLLLVTGSNSPSSLRSAPIKKLFLDETDSYKADLSEEGGPITLAEARTRTFPRRKIYKISTPTVEGKSNIEKAYKNSSMGAFFVPCPHCQYKQTLVWGQIHYQMSGDEVIESSVFYQCIECLKPIYNHQKTDMLEGGEWVHARPERTSIRGFFINSLYSPVGWFSWFDACKMYENAKKDDDLKGFYNTFLGLTFRVAGEVPDFQRLYERRESYRPNVLPPGAIIVTAGIDVQKDRVECHTVAWGRDKQRWVLSYDVFAGDVEELEVWDDLYSYLETPIAVAGSKVETKITCFAIDAGYANKHVTAFCKRFTKLRAFPIKGQENLIQLVGTPRQGEITVRGKKILSGLMIWPIGVSGEKADLYRKLNLPVPEDGKPYPKGFIHFPKTCDLEYFKRLCSEELKTKIINGFPKFYWELIHDRNEQLDTMNYASAAFSIRGFDRATEETWNTLQMDLGVSFEERPEEVDPFDIQVVEHEVIAPRAPRPAVVVPSVSVAEAQGRVRRKSKFW